MFKYYELSKYFSEHNYLFPASSPEIKAPSTMVKELMPGRTNDFRISVPVAVALMRQTLALSRADWPWSPHSLGKQNVVTFLSIYNVSA